jgi:Coenzyme Q (ubiquinone) biosynthesis protein Coq4
MIRINTPSNIFKTRSKKISPIERIKAAITSLTNLVRNIFNPCINWSELRWAYRVFIDRPSAGILHILAAGKNSRWQSWVESRLASQGKYLKDAQIVIDIDRLLELPEWTLGGGYARHITSHGFDPNAFIINQDQDWVKRRAALSHDVYHIITGFDGSPMGEFGLAAFGLVQYRDLLNTFVLSHVPYFMMGSPHKIAALIAVLTKGLRMGIRSKPIFAYPFESNWHKSITEVRSELGI